MQKIAVYCGASTGNEPAYADATVALGTWLAEHQLELVYGGGGVGLMGLLAQTVLDHGVLFMASCLKIFMTVVLLIQGSLILKLCRTCLFVNKNVSVR
ncbi:LOG family protein yvdD [Weissella viridescens]|uniref:LOG family protein yvdD n=1 Tax=Weissella viridescens TaxID=1629 RepID=A0A380P1F0_WEIVI|nr:LOG family protein yvdD [Weissella viridescens]